jgi:hypothetical protein
MAKRHELQSHDDEMHLFFFFTGPALVNCDEIHVPVSSSIFMMSRSTYTDYSLPSQAGYAGLFTTVESPVWTRMNEYLTSR